jgi:hypothetical protein
MNNSNVAQTQQIQGLLMTERDTKSIHIAPVVIPTQSLKNQFDCLVTEAELDAIRNGKYKKKLA